MNKAVDILTKLEMIRAETLNRLEVLTQNQLDWHPAENEWSLGEIFHHIALDEHYLREQIARPLLEGVKPPEDVTFLPPPPFYGAKKAVIQFWFTRARILTRRMVEPWPINANLELKHIGGLEAMNGLEWLEGFGGHEVSHQRQIDKIVTELKNHGIE